MLQRRERSCGLPDVLSRNHWLQHSKELLLERLLQLYVFSMKSVSLWVAARGIDQWCPALGELTLWPPWDSHNALTWICYMNNLRMCPQVNSCWDCTPLWLLRDIGGGSITGRKLRWSMAKPAFCPPFTPDQNCHHNFLGVALSADEDSYHSSIPGSKWCLLELASAIPARKPREERASEMPPWDKQNSIYALLLLWSLLSCISYHWVRASWILENAQDSSAYGVRT